MTELKLDWCSHDAAKYAVEHWHYSKCLPVFKVIHIGAWEDAKFIGCVLFSRGASCNISTPYNLKQIEVCELTRVALNKHITPVTRIVSIAIKMLKRSNPGLQLIVSYADSDQDHVGGIYQAGNWIYTGKSEGDQSFIINGTKVHRKSIHSKYGTTKLSEIQKMFPDTSLVFNKPKYKYLYPLTDELKTQIEPLRKPYPKRAYKVQTAERPANQQERGGANPTYTHEKELL